MTDQNPDDVERVAIALAESRCWPGCWAKANDVEKSAWRHDARAAIAAMQGWRPIESAIKSRNPILALFKDDAFPKDGRFSSFNGKQAPIFHAGFTPSGYDCGWGIALPVGFGGFNDHQFVGWQPLPQLPESSDG